MPAALLNRPATVPDVLASTGGDFKSNLHPRGPHGRFTKSFTKALTAAERKRADKAKAGFKARDFDAGSLREWQGHHSPTQLAAIKRFADGGWKTTNGDLRAGHDTQDPDVALLDASMHPLPHDVTLHRTVPVALFGHVDPGKLAGRKVADAGYASTSVNEPTPDGSAVVRMHISAPAGAPAMPTGENGEVVLGRDTEMVVESVTPDGHGGYDMQLTILPKGRTRAPAKKVAPEPAGKPAAEDTKPAPAPKPTVKEPVKQPPTPEPPAKEAAPKPARKRPAKKAAPAPVEQVPAAQPKTPAKPAASPSPTELAPAGPGAAGLSQFVADAEHGTGKTTVKLAGGMSADTSLVTLADGRKAVFKRAPEWGDPDAPKTQADAEYLASLIAAAIDAPAPSVARDGFDAVWMQYIPGRTVGQVATREEPSPYRDLVEGPDGARLGLLDALTVNLDRNTGNMLVGDDGHLYGIDHGFSFALFHEGAPPNNLGNPAGVPLEHFVKRTDGTNEWVGNPLTEADVAHVRGQLDSLRPQFEALGRGGWLDNAHKMLDGLAPHAHGTQSIFAGEPSAAVAEYTGPSWSMPADVNEVKVGDLRQRIEGSPYAATRGAAAAKIESDPEAKRLARDLGPAIATRLAWESDAQAASDRFVLFSRPPDPALKPTDDPPPVTDEERAAARSSAEEALQREWAGKKVATRVTAAGLADILDEGRFKTQFETGRSGGGYRPALRAASEQMMFGIPKKADPKTRPIYGYLAMDGIEATHDDDLLNTYGDIQVVFKDVVRSRATASVGDTLDQGILPSPVDHPSWYSFNPSAHNYSTTIDYAASRPVLYVETQIHGGVSAGDIEEVVFPKEPAKAIRDRLERLGLSWRVLAR